MVVQDGTPVQVTVTNTRQTGELVVTKVIEGEVAGASTTFPIAVDCDADAYDDHVRSDGARRRHRGQLGSARDPGRGDLHGDREPGPDGWGLTGIAPNGGVVTIVEDTSEVTLTNHRLRRLAGGEQGRRGRPRRHHPGVYRRSGLRQRLQRRGDARPRR